MKKTYKVQIKCWNCGEINFLEIPEGTTIDDFLDKNNCYNCGCHTRLK